MREAAAMADESWKDILAFSVRGLHSERAVVGPYPSVEWHDLITRCRHRARSSDVNRECHSIAGGASLYCYWGA